MTEPKFTKYQVVVTVIYLTNHICRIHLNCLITTLEIILRIVKNQIHNDMHKNYQFTNNNHRY